MRLALAAIAVAGCVPGGAQRLVLRPPWIEDREVALQEERLVLRVAPDHVHVDVRYRFDVDALRADLPLELPIPARRGAVRDLRVTIGAPGRAPVPLHVRVDSSPDGGTIARFRAPRTALLRHGGRLHVRYADTSGPRVAYWLESGASWRGAVGRLDVVVTDPQDLLASATLAGAEPHGHGGGRLWWRMRDEEPRGRVVLVRGASRMQPRFERRYDGAR